MIARASFALMYRCPGCHWQLAASAARADKPPVAPEGPASPLHRKGKRSSRDRRGSRGCSRLILAPFFLMLTARTFATPADAGDREAVELDQLETRVARIVERVTELAGADDLLDSLHFGWFDRPYARASLAILVKTTHAFQREIHLRRHQNGAIANGELRAMLSWAEAAIQRVCGPPLAAGFRPDRLRMTGMDLAEAAPTPALFAFVDRATATRSHRSFGDLDLLAALGSRVYARLGRDRSGGDLEHTLVERAHALGIAVVVTSSPLSSAAVDYPPLDFTRSADQPTLQVEPWSLRMFWEASANIPNTPARSVAVMDPPFGESWGSALARRALARGVLARTRYVVDGWRPPATGQSYVDRAGLTAAAMWVHALEGQSLGLVRGWRDLRDGSASPYPSVFVDPGGTETVAHTALDLVRLGQYVMPFRPRPSLVIVLGTEAIDPQDDNAWAPWIKPIWAGLLNRQIRFDVVTRNLNPDQLRRRYRAVLPLHMDDADDITSVFLRLDRMLAKDPEHSRRLKVRESDGGPAAGVFVRSVRTPQGAPCVALVNFSSRTRRVRFEDGPRLGPMHDVVTDMPVRHPRRELVLQPWQLRLLWTTD